MEGKWEGGGVKGEHDDVDDEEEEDQEEDLIECGANLPSRFHMQISKLNISNQNKTHRI